MTAIKLARARPAARIAAPLAVLAVLAAMSGCAGPAPAAHRSTASAGNVTISAADRPACAVLLTRLQLVTVAISNDSELLTSSQDAQQLGQRISAEAKQLTQSAEWMSTTPAPAALAPTQRKLVSALMAFSADLTRAAGAAQLGDLQGAVNAMGDKPVIGQIVGTSATIQRACAPGARTP
ncbi:MAG: hypothetical protein J2P27_10980 [Actinobacteria bacterium]|nr:hypothetical protein [Actinomycetota bacterium]